MSNAQSTKLEVLIDVAGRLERGEPVSDLEAEQAFADAPADTIDAIEAAISAAGIPGLLHLPPALNRGCPEFLAAMEALRDLTESGGSADECARQWSIIVAYAPPWFMAAMGDKAREFGLMPEAVGYLADGTAMFRLEDVAEKMGMEPDEAQALIQEFIEDREAMGLSMDGFHSDAALIHRVQ
ncbi:hypothetical protein [Propionivibrio sp.]|uniref:hypothetical protein n=1 Tax=Propionivibrio sp. TaxID=2212460 RepID=UPI003BF1ACAE